MVILNLESYPFHRLAGGQNTVYDICISTKLCRYFACFFRKMGKSVFERLKKHELKYWLEDYSLADLWRKNIITGGHSQEKSGNIYRCGRADIANLRS